MRPCIQCRLQRCHVCRDDDGKKFEFPFCMGGAAMGFSRCTCWPETPKQRRAREAYSARLLAINVQQRIRQWRESRTFGFHAAEISAPLAILHRLELVR